MSKRFTFKSVLTLVVILLSALVLVACGDDNQEAVDAAIDTLALPFATGDSATNVTQNLTLPTEVADVTITWVSSHPAVVSNAGVVTRPAFGQADVPVTLTATLTLGDAEGEKTFTITVKAMTQTDQEAVTAAIAALDITLQTGNTAATVTGNITLPATQGTTTVAWSSSNTAVVSNAGVVTRPAAGLNNAVVTLTATVTKGSATGTKTFTVTVLAHPVVVTDQDAVDEALNVLNIGLQTGDTLSSITGNVTLPATQNTLAVSWSSSNAAVVSNAGVVTLPGKGMDPVVVTLTAEISKGIGFGSKTFTLTVQPEPYTVADVLDELVITGDTVTYNAENDRYTTLTDIVLPTSILGFDIEWSSANTAVITNAGVVTRPAYGQNDSTVFLTATIADEEFQFVVVVTAITVKPDELVLSEASDSLLLAGIANGVASDLVLPLVVGTEGVTVTWESDTPNVLSNTGTVSRQPEHTNVVLTATLHFNGKTLEKEFEIVVLRFADFVEVASIAAAIEWFQTGVAPDPEVPINYYVKIPGVTILGLTSEGFMFADATGMSFAYTQAAPNPNWVVGGVYDFYGLLDFFNGNIQFNGVKSVSQPIQMIESDADVTVVAPTPVTDVVAYIASLPTSYPDKANPLTHQYIQLTAKVRYQSADNYHTMFVNSDYAGGDIDTAAQSAFTTNALIVYYKSNKAALVPFDGITVTVNVFLYTLRNDRNLYTVIFTGTADDVVLDIDDAGLVDLVKTTLEGSYGSEYDEPTTLDLPETLLGATVEWSSESPYIDEATGAVTMPATGQESVTLTATITKNAATTTATITFLVGELPVTDLSVARGLDLNTKVRVEGTISSVSFATDDLAVLFLQDATGGIYVYKVPASFKSSLVVGNKIEIFGSIGSFGSSPQIINITDVNVIETGLTVTPVVVTEAQGLIDNQGELVSVTGYLRQDYTGTPSDYHLITDMGTFALRLVSGSDSIAADRTAIIDLLVAAAAGAEVTVIGGAQRNGSTYQVMLFSTSLITVGAVGAEADLADALAANYVSMVGNDAVTADLTLPTTSFVGSTVVWSSSNTDVISNTGVVTRPAIGQPDAVVTLTYTVTLGATEVATGTVEFTVLALVEEIPAAQEIDLFISEYVEPSTGNSKAFEIYNPTNKTIDLSNYQIIQYNNGKTTAEVAYKLDLVGTLAPGQTFVVYNVESDPNMVTLIQANADVYQASIPYSSTLAGGAVMGFNGDDAIVLAKKDTLGEYTIVVDSLGKVGVDPGSAWVSADTLVSTANMTLVRKPTVLYGRTDITADFDPSEEWIPFAAQTWTDLGSHTIYSPDLFISEYVEPSTGNSKAFEIYNNTGATVDLSNYQIIQYNNGKTTAEVAYKLDLVGTLAHGQTFVVYNVESDPNMVTLIQANADVYQASIPYSSTLAGGAVMGFNGDDAIVLAKKDTLGEYTIVVDSLGKVGVDPGSAWVSADTLVSTANMTLVRKPTVLYGRTDITADFDPSEEWIPFAAQTWTDLGSHTMN